MEPCSEMDPLRDLKPDSFVLKEETGTKRKYGAEGACDYKLSFTKKERSECDDAEYKCNGEKEKSSIKVEPTDCKDLDGNLKTETSSLEEGIGESSKSKFVIKKEPDVKEFVPTHDFFPTHDVKEIVPTHDVKEFVPTHDVKGSVFTDIKGKSFTNCFVLLQKIKKDDYKKYRVRPEEVFIVNCHNKKLNQKSIHSPYLSEELCETDEESEESSRSDSKIIEIEENIDDESLKGHFLYSKESETDDSNDGDLTYEMPQTEELNCNASGSGEIQLKEEDKLKELDKLVNDHRQEKYCKLCNKSAPTKLHFMQHLKIKPFACLTCNQSFTQKVHLQAHMLHIHSTLRQHSCPTCGKEFKTRDSVRIHIKSVHSASVLKCSECNKKFKTRNTLQLHLKIHNNIRPHVCPICDKSFVQKGNMIQHKMLHYEERPFSCSLCPMKFKIKKDLSRHMVKHTDIYKYCCSHCGKKFKYKNMYNHHVALHENPNAFTCNVCHKICDSYHNLRTHMRSHEDKTFLCDECDKSFPNVQALRAHKGYVHSTKIYKCDCGKQFAHRQYLRQHVKKYCPSSRVSFPCDLCSNTYSSKYSLANHKKKHH